jgi:DNA-binding protein HU-beta
VNKSELIDAIAAEAKLTKVDAGNALDATIAVVTQTLKKGDKIALVGFGTFQVDKRAARKGRNPQTGKQISIPATNVPKFRPGKTLKDAVNAKRTAKK